MLVCSCDEYVTLCRVQQVDKAPWKPAEVEQRDGRILRQGNTNAEVSIYRYVTEGSFDACMWQALETKARFIAQVITGDSAVRQAEDIGGQELSYAEVKAIASGNLAVLTLAESDAELTRLTLLKKHHADEQYLARRRLRELPETITRLERRVAGLTQDIATADTHRADPLTSGGRRCGKDEALELMTAPLQSLPVAVSERRTIPLGVYRGLRFGIALDPYRSPEISVEGAAVRFGSLSRDHQGPQAVLNAVERLVGTAELERDRAARDLAIAQGQRRDFEARLGARFAHETYLDELTSLHHQLELGLSGTEPVDRIVTLIMALRAAHTVESAPPRTFTAATAEEPVTARIRGRARPQSDPPLPEAPKDPDLLSPAATLTTLFELSSQPQRPRPRAQPSRPRSRRGEPRQLSLF